MTAHSFHSQYIDDPTDLERLCRQWQHSARLAIDTEFVGEDSFIPRLELIQVASVDAAAAIDFPALHAKSSMNCLWEIIRDPSIEKVVHAGRQDLELFAVHAGQIPTPFFDTQIAAAMVGYGSQIAYAGLVQRVHGTKLAKSHTFTNWSQRPLTEEQITYALDDVQYLLPIHDHLRARILSLGRTEWLREEFGRLHTSLGEKAQHPQDRWRRIRGWENLKPRSAAVLREVTAWREDEARRRNVPRNRVMRDEVLLQLARQAPRRVEELRAIRGVHPAEAERNGEALLARIKRAHALPATEWPDVPHERKPEPEADGQVEFLQALLKTCALEANIAPSLLATTADLQALVDAKRDRSALDLPILRGWRRQLVGEKLLDLLAGKLTMSIDQETRKLKIAAR
ncbi:MAG: ribonuclease D [Nitrospiraceae bacterium]